jgi:hypothetical protein
MDPGDPEREYIAEPLEDPVPTEPFPQPDEEPRFVPAPAREPVKVPA